MGSTVYGDTDDNDVNISGNGRGAPRDDSKSGQTVFVLHSAALYIQLLLAAYRFAARTDGGRFTDYCDSIAYRYSFACKTVQAAYRT